MTTLKNKYLIMRHGQSTANTINLIVSDPKNGIPAYGLSEFGKNQVHDSILAAQQNDAALSKESLIVSSDFLRCRETAQLVQELLGCKPFEVDIRLRERFFGQFELKTNSGYELVWAEDKRHPETGAFEAESVESVFERAFACVKSLEERSNGQTILLVSHGDTLQILSTYFNDLDHSEHRSIPAIQTAEIRLLNVG